MSHPERPFYRYDLQVEIPATEVAVLVDALDGEELSLRARLGAAELRRQLEAQRLEIEVLSDESWPEFERDIKVLSTYLSEPISGREFYVGTGPDRPELKGWVILGRRGETARLALDLDWDAEEMVVVDRGIDKDEARKRAADLPDWVQTTITSGLHSG